jgi:hypothetical protein
VCRETISTQERRLNMANTIKWEKDFSRTLTLARAENKMVLLDFFNPG